MKKGVLYMIPSPIAAGAETDALTERVREVLGRLDHFIAEDVRTVRRFISKAATGRDIGTLCFAELNEHTRPEELEVLIAPLLAGQDAGMVSEAGLPGIADPGADLVLLCHRHGIRVVPLSGPSSLLMALMASGLNGQSFAFNGYLPVKPPERAKAIRRLEQRASTERQSQIFIETPYRNVRVLEDVMSACRAGTLLTVAADISGPAEFIRTMTVGEWRKAPAPPIHKVPAVFVIL
ncbi:MAG: SAM-dependent methyltransferase [Alistipes sp.]|nr:SAM-dependent methyltransferase [Alistipes sp.]